MIPGHNHIRGKKLHSRFKKKQSLKGKYLPFRPIDFSLVRNTALCLADHIELHYEKIASILLEYESFEVVQDEISRALDLLKNLDENKQYFCLRVGAITSFLPKNQPLYALTCFVIVPSLMASEVHFRIPHCMKSFFPRLLHALDFKTRFPNVMVSVKERLDFLEERSALKTDPRNLESAPVTDAVIFTGTPHHAERLRLVFDKRTLFISNGAGHNPVVVGEKADILRAVEAVMILQLYNQGQDCAAPNAILVHRNVYSKFLQLLRVKLKEVKVGFYSDRTCRVGPISEPEDLNRIQAIFIENRFWLDSSTPGIIRAKDAIVEPTIICKPLKEGGNFTEVFAPIFFIHRYEKDVQLSQYFESNQYERNAMYVSLFGESDYISSLPSRKLTTRILHDKFTILYNTHLHATGVERGTQPYGGYGYGASSISINGKIISKPTLPPREIFYYLVKPLIKKKKILNRLNVTRKANVIVKKDIRKLLGIKGIASNASSKPNIQSDAQSSILYIDSRDIKSHKERYFHFSSEKVFCLRSEVNLSHAAGMEIRFLKQVRALRKYLIDSTAIDLQGFNSFLYSISATKNLTEANRKADQLIFFKHLYQLLFGKDYGPRLAIFLLEADRDKIIELLNI